MTHGPKKVGILVGGGPAPGINAVIGAATIRAVLAGFDVIGIQDGFQWIMKGDTSKARQLSIEDVNHIHFRGGSYLGISRSNPTKSPELLEETVLSLLRLDIDKLITIGGDDTAFSASRIAKQSQGRLRVADGSSAYLPLAASLANATAIFAEVKSLLQPEERTA